MSTNKIEDINIVTLIETETGQASNKKGRSHQMSCPFPDHRDSDPSFHIYEESGSWFCFGCQVGGSAVDFVMHWHKYSTGDAFRYLRGEDLRGNAPSPEVTLPRVTRDEPKTKERRFPFERAKLKDIGRWHDKLMSKAGRAAYNYLTKERGIAPTLLAAFDIGWTGRDTRLDWWQKDMLVFPYHYTNGEDFWGYKLRSIEEKRFAMMKKDETEYAPYLFDRVLHRRNSPFMFATEGEIDALTIVTIMDQHCAFGCPVFAVKPWHVELLDYTQAQRFNLGDMDSKGLENADYLWRLGSFTHLPIEGYKDINEAWVDNPTQVSKELRGYFYG